ncbi:site-specific integrase [Sporolactobacillus shoreae]|uniref:Site-specific integrase n=1 Tax=Sporolactobacillus shoreae TaxID=1465501 RepID=A0A4Z0GJ36_9BACL|nr:site-specific integrase [Sporolactobacillus shoreae]TGA95979.1 site-specific integrase [Sporolactobacillus shoreae]
MAYVQDLGNDRYKIFVDKEVPEGQPRKRRSKTVTAKSDRALKKAITAFEIQVSKEKPVTLNNVTFSKFADRWMAMHVKPDLSARTYDMYSYQLENQREYFGTMKLAKIRPFHIMEYFDAEKKAGRRSLVSKYSTLNALFSYAFKAEVVDENPMKKVSKPKDEERKRPFKFYDEDNMKLVIKTLNEKAKLKTRVEVKLAMLCGLRLGEIAGLQIQSLNFKDNTIYVDHSLEYSRKLKRLVFGPPKNKKPRTVMVPSTFSTELEIYQQWQKKRKSENIWHPMLDESGEPIDFLFTNFEGYPHNQITISGNWRNFVERTGIPYLNFHGLRHTCASFMVMNDVNFKVIQEQLGHSSLKMTVDTYSHLEKKKRQSAAELFNEVL